MKSFHLLYVKFIAPRSSNEDLARKEFILNIFLCVSVFLFFTAFTINLIDSINGVKNAVSPGSLLVLPCFSGGLLLLSRKGWIYSAALALIATFFALAAYLSFTWGIDLPSALLIYALTVVMAGVLINSRFAFSIVVLVVMYIILLSILQTNGLTPTDQYWRKEQWIYSDTIVVGIIFLIIAIVSWLSNREIAKSLNRAQISESELMLERDLLEIRVQERTAELRAAELERMSQTYKFVEFGRLAGGIFHDLTGPLAALSLNLESIMAKADNHKNVSRFIKDIERAQVAAEHMQKLMEAFRRHLIQDGRSERFSLTTLLREAMPVLTSYARRNKVSITYSSKIEIELQGDPSALLQVVTNIVCNAIESFSCTETKKSSIDITLEVEVNEAVLKISDTGCGMNEDTKRQIFDPFFTTKSDVGGLGIGLTLARRILEKSLGGRLVVESKVGKGTVFTLFFPKL